MQEIPLQAAPSQVTRVVLAGQNCQIFIYEKDQGLFIDVNADGVDIVVGVIARDAVPIICREYDIFNGNLMFIDTQDSADPDYTGLGARFALVYLDADENALIQQ